MVHRFQDGPQIPRWYADPLSYWAFDDYEQSILYWDKNDEDWNTWCPPDDNEERV